MAMRLIVFLFALTAWYPFCGLCQSAKSLNLLHLKVFVQGDTSRLPDFVESMRREFLEQRMEVDLVEHGSDYDYNIVLAQESSVSGARLSKKP
jgi:hypothetical protein